MIQGRGICVEEFQIEILTDGAGDELELKRSENYCR